MKKNHRDELHRRGFLAAAGETVVIANILRAGPGILAGSATLWPVAARAQTGDALVQPAAIQSRNGVLETALTAAPGTVRLGNLTFQGTLYNGSYLPPLLRVRAGDVLRIAFRNDLPGVPSNLHFHGMSVSPKGNSDNVFIHVHPGQNFNYEVIIPANGRQGPGLFWYHPHAHGFVLKQMLGGMSGGLVVDGLEQIFPILEGLPERFLFIKHAEIDGREVVSINGQINPIIEIKPGEIQFWRLAHIGAALFLKLRLEGMPLYAIATDGHPLTRPRKITEIFIGPGERIDALVIGPPGGSYALHTVPFQNQAWRAPEPAQQIVTILAAGSGGSAQDSQATIMGQHAREQRWINEVRAAPIAHRRMLAYSRTEDRQEFMIDGRVMEEGRIDQMVKLGDTEEWTIVNTDQQYHSFHIHQTPFLVTKINGVPHKVDSLRDTFSVPPATEIGPGSLTVVIPFTDPVIAGRFVCHCHAVDHEDKGMMGVIEVAE